MIDRIAVDPAVHFGKPCVARTRITVQNVLESVNEGGSFDAVIRDYCPGLTVDGVHACLEYAVGLEAFEDVRLGSTGERSRSDRITG